MMETLLYFTLNRTTLKAFRKYVKGNRFEYRHAFRLVAYKESLFSHVSDLALFLSQKQALSHIKVIIDYVSLTCPHDKETIKDTQDAIRRVILQYPEVLFLFDETGCNEESYKFSFSDFLFPNCGSLVDEFLFKEYHQFSAKGKSPFLFFERSRNNLFDGSNLRYVTKRFLYGDLKVGKHNFGIIQSSRAKNLALCVEEEDGQSRFNCYSLYSNGYRALPVLSATELQHFNEKHKDLRPSIITRDYDLQFDDIKQSPSSSEFNEVDLVRGYKYYEEQQQWKILTHDSKYWNNFVNNYPILFVTKGPDRLSVEISNPPQALAEGPGKGNTLLVQGIRKPVPGIYTSFQDVPYIFQTASGVITYFNRKWLFSREASYRVLYEAYLDKAGQLKAIDKELSNIEQCFNNRCFDEKVFNQKTVECIQKQEALRREQSHIIELYKKTVDKREPDSPLRFRVMKSASHADYIWMHQIYSLKTSRADHDHGVPLNVYDMVKDMVDRAKRYYEEKRYIRASIVSWEAIEVMNGFHETLTLEAYHIYALSDNAIAMNVLGGKEEELTADTVFRIRKIRADINRLLYRHQNNTERRKFAMNALNQIFSDCRAFCKQKEHFDSEEVFISAIGHLNDSDPTYGLFMKGKRRLRDKFYETQSRFRLWRTLKNTK